jgi:hypothetical protein
MAAYDAARQVPTSVRQASTRKSLVQFLRALEQHDVGAIESLLAEDVRTTTDGGGQFRAALRTIAGREKVMRFYLAVAENAARGRVRMTMLNGVPLVVVDIPSPAAGIAQVHAHRGTEPRRKDRAPRRRIRDAEAFGDEMNAQYWRVVRL